MSHSILADECVDFRIVKELRKQGFHVISVVEESPAIPDSDVLRLAKSHHAILLTEDSDFGRWIFAHHEEGVGVIFLRYANDELHKIIFSLIHVLNLHGDALPQKFVVIRANKIRIRDI